MSGPPVSVVSGIIHGEHSHYAMQIGTEDAAAEDVERVADVADRVSGERLQGVMRSYDIVRRRETGWRERDFARGGVKERSKDEEETGIQRG